MCKAHENMGSICLNVLCYILVVIQMIYCSTNNANQASKPRGRAESLFTTLFKKRRAEQIVAIKNLLAMNYEKQHKLVSIITEKAFNVLQSGRAILENSGYTPGVSEFPTEEKILDALANILENTALVGDVLLRLPDISHAVLASQHEWLKLYQWSVVFSNQTELLDKQSEKLIYLVSQELNITQRDADYINPYKKKHQHQNSVDKTQTHTKKYTKEKRIKKGPRLSAGEL